MTLDDLAGCARDAGWTAALDPDHAYVAITAAEPADRPHGFLRLADGAVYGYTTPPRGANGTRAELEAEVAAAARANVAHSAKLAPIIERTDRSRAIWIAGTADDTSLAGKVGAISGWIDVRHGLALSVDAEVKDDRLATQAVDGFGSLQAGSLLLGSEVSAALEHVHLTRSGDHLRLAADLSATQLEALYSKLAKMRH
jgi:hypothetical protein